jgi:hypothetical protein
MAAAEVAPRSLQQPLNQLSSSGEVLSPTEPPVQHKILDSADRVAPSEPESRPSIPGSSRPLDTTTRELMESRFGESFAGVRIHTDDGAALSARSMNALAYSSGSDVVFGKGQYAPETLSGRRLLAHELTHVVQQRLGEFAGFGGDEPELEREAWKTADSVASGGRAAVSAIAASGQVYRSTLSAALSAAWTARHNKGEIFDLLRAAAPAPGDTDTLTALATIFPGATDDSWLAGQIMTFGPETLWPPVIVSERVRRAATGRWSPEAGNISAVLPDRGAAGSTPPSVEAFFFPGRTDRRALIIGGVHGSEPQGVAAVQQLRTLLATRSAAGHPPFFTTITVPILIPRTVAPASRLVPDTLGISVSGSVIRHRADPNRNFPLPGEGLATAIARGAASPTAPELHMFDPAAPGGTRAPHDVPGDPIHQASSIRMIPETRILIGLIERFQPERIASVHGHKLKGIIGDLPGIFVDPRGLDPRTRTVTNAAQVAEDDRLATAMVREGRSRLAAAPLPATTSGNAPFDPFAGNAPAGSPRSTVHYASTARAEGISLGDWAPVPVTGAGARSGITTVTVEVPKYDRTAASALARVEDLDVHLLAEIFLEDPSTVTPASAPTVP